MSLRRIVAWIGIVLAVGGFTVLALSLWLGIHFMIPVLMIAAAFGALVIARRMPSDIVEEQPSENAENGENNGQEE
jgi:hypothetical protein